MGLARDDGAPPVRPDQLPLLDNLLDQLALALERGRLESEAREFARVRERDQVRSVLLSSIGQDLEPPLKAIGEAARALRRSGDRATGRSSRSVGSEASKLERYLANLLALGPESDRAAARGRRRHDRPVPAHGVPRRGGGPSDAEGISPCSPSWRSIRGGC